MTFTAHAVAAGQDQGPEWWQYLLRFTLLPLGIAAPFGTTILGCVALSQIRRSAGKLYGLGLALFDALLFPLLALDGLIALFWSWVFHDLIRASIIAADSPVSALTVLFVHHSTEIVVVLTISVSLVVDYLLIRRAWPAAKRPPSTAESAAAAKAAERTERSTAGNWAVACLIGGLVLPLLTGGLGRVLLGFHVTWAMMLALAAVLELSALILGIVGWRSFGGKVAAIGAALLLMVSIPVGIAAWLLVANRTHREEVMLKARESWSEARTRERKFQLQSAVDTELNRRRVQYGGLSVHLAPGMTNAFVEIQGVRDLEGSGNGNVSGELTANYAGGDRWELHGDGPLAPLSFPVFVPMPTAIQIAHRGGFPGDTLVMNGGLREAVQQKLWMEIGRTLDQAGASFADLQVSVAADLRSARVLYEGLRDFRRMNGGRSGSQGGSFSMQNDGAGRWTGRLETFHFTVDATAEMEGRPGAGAEPEADLGARALAFVEDLRAGRTPEAAARFHWSLRARWPEKDVKAWWRKVTAGMGGFVRTETPIVEQGPLNTRRVTVLTVWQKGRMGLRLSFFPTGQIEGVTLLPQVTASRATAVVQPSPSGERTAAASFGPVIERTLRYDRSGQHRHDIVWLKDGAMSSLPAGFFDRSGSRLWLNQRGPGIFPGYGVTQPGKAGWGLGAAGMRFAAAPDDWWDQPPDPEAVAALVAGPRVLSEYQIQGGSISWLPDTLTMPMTVAFRQETGLCGLIQIQRFTDMRTVRGDEPGTVTIRIKLARSPGVQVIAAPAASAMVPARLQFRLVAQEHDDGPWDPMPDPERAEEPGSLPVLLEVLLDESVLSAGTPAHATRSPEGLPQLKINFNQAGRERLNEITSRNIGRKLAIVFDGRVLSAPVIRDAIFNGEAVITGRLTEAQVDALAQTLNALRRPQK